MGNTVFEKYVNEFKEQTETPTYKRNVSHFLDYVVSIRKGDTVSNISKEDFINSVEILKDNGVINTESTLSIYLESVKSLYSYLLKTYGTTNIFNSVTNYKEFKSEISEKFSLKNTNKRDFLPLEVVIKLLKYFDDNRTCENSEFQVIKLFIKLTLIAPAKRSVISNIKFCDFKNDFRILNINGFDIDIPNSLRRDIIFAIEMKKKNYHIDTGLFEYLYDKTFTPEVFNRLMYNIFNQINYYNEDDKKHKSKTKTEKVETLMNTAIYFLLKNKANPFLISKIANLSLKRIEEKIIEYGLEENLKCNQINSSISDLAYYKYI